MAARDEAAAGQRDPACAPWSPPATDRPHHRAGARLARQHQPILPEGGRPCRVGDPAALRTGALHTKRVVVGGRSLAGLEQADILITDDGIDAKTAHVIGVRIGELIIAPAGGRWKRSVG